MYCPFKLDYYFVCVLCMHLLSFKIQKFRILEIFNLHPCIEGRYSFIRDKYMSESFFLFVFGKTQLYGFMKNDVRYCTNFL